MGTLNKYFWTTSHCGRALFLAAPFGYGPRVAAQTMAKLLKLRLNQWQLNSDGDRQDGTSVRVLLNFGVDMPPNTASSTNRVWIDCLMWLRGSLPKAIKDYDLLLAESFFETRAAFRGLPALRDISPLLSSAATENGHEISSSQHIPVEDGHERNSPKCILVSFGGVETPFTKDVHRWLLPRMILKSLLAAMRDRGDLRQIICCLPNHLRDKLSHQAEFAPIRFLSPDHQDFLRLLNTASLYVVQPGLYGPFEGFERRIPTAFCTPFSYTQVCQARKYQEHGILGDVPLWDELNEEIGALEGNIATEEVECFVKMEKWLKERVGNSSMAEWSSIVLNDHQIPARLTAGRKSFAQSRREINNGFIKNILSLIN